MVWFLNCHRLYFATVPIHIWLPLFSTYNIEWFSYTFVKNKLIRSKSNLRGNWYTFANTHNEIFHTHELHTHDTLTTQNCSANKSGLCTNNIFPIVWKFCEYIVLNQTNLQKQWLMTYKTINYNYNRYILRKMFNKNNISTRIRMLLYKMCNRIWHQ